MVTCPKCGSDDLSLVREISKHARIVRCDSCGHEWRRGEARREVVPGRTKDERLRARFPTASDVAPGRLEELGALAAVYPHDPDPAHAEFRDRYGRLLSPDQLHDLSMDEFTHFYRSPLLASIGLAGMALDTRVRTEGGDYLRRCREAIDYLLNGTQGTLESRYTNLVDGDRSPAVPGLKETVLAKVLAVTMPTKVFPLLKYDSENGKRQIARGVFGLELPARDAVDWTIGRLAIWSSDLFAELTSRWSDDFIVGAGFVWEQWVRVR